MARAQPAGPGLGHQGAEPEILRSQGGQLEVRLQAEVGTHDIAGRKAQTMGYNGGVPGPTLRLRPGDTLRLDLVNRSQDATNLYVHGLHVSPEGNGDNIFLAVEPGRTQRYEYRLTTDDHPPGVYWYHPHHHGNVADQVNVAEVIAVAAATLSGWPLPLLPLQILYLNVITDVFPALALGVGPASGQEMKDPPRDPHEAVLTRRHWGEIIGLAAVVATAVLAGLLLAERWLDLAPLEAVTVSFLTLAFGKLWFTFNLRNPRSGLLRNEITRNPWVWAAIALCVVLLVAAVYLPVLSDLLQTQAVGWEGWALLLAMSAVPLLAGQVLRETQRRSYRGSTPV